MKKQLLEYLIRECVKEVLETFPNAIKEVDDETVGAPAPPADGQGTADQPEIPRNQPEVPQSAPQRVDMRGLWYVDPKKPNQPEPLKLSGGEPAKLERELYRTASRSAGPRVKISSETLREVPKVLANPSSAMFLYIGKRDPEDPDTELFLLPAKTLDQARAGSVQPTVSAEHPSTAISAPPTDAPQLAQAAASGGKTTAPDIDETKDMFSSMVREALNEVRKK